MPTLLLQRFLVGVAIFFTGMAINMHADYTLINLRKPGETGYKIPRGTIVEFAAKALKLKYKAICPKVVQIVVVIRI